VSDASNFDPRRFLVAVNRLAIYSGVYSKGEVITDFQAGTARDRLLAEGVLVPMDYDLSSLNQTPFMT
jgi:hypothetical protein